ncbi:MAG: STM3941 family protein [Flavisolibacter sp.]
MLFFGLCAYFFSRKLPDNKPGLIIDDTGLVDNSGGLSAGDILLSDIEEISVMQIQKQKMIMIYVINPQDYIDRQTSFLKRKGMQLNYKTYGTPISITSTGLKTTFDELYQAITNNFHEKNLLQKLLFTNDCSGNKFID